MSRSPEFGVLLFPGINCEAETFDTLNQAGAAAQFVHIADVKSGEVRIDNLQGLFVPGGFSYGDIIRAGAIAASDMRTSIVADQLNAFVEARKPVLGNCNGNQILLESGLLQHGRIDPDDKPTFTLDRNANMKFECRWVKARVEDTVCPFIPKEDVGRIIELPVAHAEGRIVARDPNDYAELVLSKQVVLRYCDSNGNPTEEHPDNPNGSPLGIAGTCSPNEIVFGMMPHDERFTRREHHPNWRRPETIFAEDFAAKIIQGAVNYAKEM